MRHAASSNSSTHARILLIDDNRLGLLARKAVLEELGYLVTTATSGHEALERMAESGFELVVTDYKMPRMNGLEFIREVRQRDSSLPIILLSGFVEVLGLDPRSTGANVVIQKSANEVAHMVRAVRKLLRREVPRKPPLAHEPAVKAQRRSG